MSARKPNRALLAIGAAYLLFVFFAGGAGVREAMLGWLGEKGIPQLDPGSEPVSIDALRFAGGGKIEWDLFTPPEEQRLTLDGWKVSFPSRADAARDPGCGADCAAAVVMEGGYCQGTLQSLYPYVGVACGFHAWKMRDGRDVCFISFDGDIPAPPLLGKDAAEMIGISPPSEMYFEKCPEISWH